jgi:hypothetical protein
MLLHNEIKQSNEKRNWDLEVKLINDLMIEIRKDIGLTKKDDVQKFDFHLIGKRK